MLEFDIELKRRDFDLKMQGRFTKGINGVFGPSGSGKSTLLKTLCGLIRPDRGFIRCDEEVVFHTQQAIDIPAQQRAIGMVFQDARVFPHLTVKKNLIYGRQKQGQNAGPSFEDTLALLEIEPLLNKKGNELSGGEQRRVALGRALLARPRWLLLDEPLSGLDRRLARQVLNLIIKCQATFAIPMIYVSHDMSEIARLSNSWTALHQGKILASGDHWDLIKQRDTAKVVMEAGLPNVLRLRVKEQKPSDGITVFHPTEGKQEVFIRAPYMDSAPGTFIDLFLRPEDIALSRQWAGASTIRNNIPVHLEDMVEIDHRVFCRLNGSLDLIAEITPSSVNELKLRVGDHLLARFKAHALHQ